MLNTAWVSVLSGCMMGGGMGHTSGTDWMGETGYAKDGQRPPPLQRAEASSAGLTIALSFPTPSSNATVPIDARLFADSAELELIDATIWLRIQTPSGEVAELRMQRLDPSSEGAYQARYTFTTAGLYLLTAEGQTGTGADKRAVSVTARAQVNGHGEHGGHDWNMPAAVLGGVAMVAMMAVMMGGSWH
jgi:hypothetical protein